MAERSVSFAPHALFRGRSPRLVKCWGQAVLVPDSAPHAAVCRKAVFEREIAAGKFLEYAHVHGNIYGTSIAAVQAVGEAGRTCILDIDVQGAQLVKNSPLQALFVFILPPSEAELERRLRGR